MTHMNASVWLSSDARVKGVDYGKAASSMWLGDDLTLFGEPEVLGMIGERMAEEAHKIIYEREIAAGLVVMAEEARDVAD